MAFRCLLDAAVVGIEVEDEFRPSDCKKLLSFANLSFLMSIMTVSMSDFCGGREFLLWRSKFCLNIEALTETPEVLNEYDPLYVFSDRLP